MRLIKIDNCRIKTKLWMIFLFCVLVPVCATNVVCVEAVKKKAIRDEASDMNNMMERIKYNITANITGSISIASHIYTDKKINTFLSKHYLSNMDYYDAFNELMKNSIFRYYYNSQNISNITIFADNPTIVNGGCFLKVDSIQDKDWYEKFKESGASIFLTTYFDKATSYTSKNTSRTVSLVKQLDYFSGIDKLLKIDLDYSMMQRQILNENHKARVYVCNEDSVLFSNQSEENIRTDFMPLSELNIGEANYAMPLRVINEQWTIYIFTQKINIWPLLFASDSMIWPLILLNLLLPTIIISLIAKSFTSRVRLIERYLDKVKRESFEVIEGETGRDEIGDLMRSYNLMVTKIKNLIEVVLKGNAEKQALQLSKKEAELKALQSQINPHFMFNTLESIRMRSLIKKEEETAEIIGELSLLLRKSFSWDSHSITLEEEMGFVQKYLNLQKYRFGDKLSFYFFVMPECRALDVPKFCILNFVENACVHGIESIAKSGSISVTVTKDERYLYFEISDTGCGMEPQKLEEIKQNLNELKIEKLSESKSTGMLNTLIRLSLFCDGNIKFEIESETGKGTDVMIRIPFNKERVEEDDKSTCCG